jgi:predicted secreted protein
MITSKDGKVGLSGITELREAGFDFAEEFLVDCTRGLQTIDDEEVRAKCERAQHVMAQIVGVLTAEVPPEPTEENLPHYQAIFLMLRAAFGARQYLREIMLREAGHGDAIDELIGTIEARIAEHELEDAEVH